MSKTVEEFFNMMYPEYDKLTDDEKKKADRDRAFIVENIEDMNSEYEEKIGPYGAMEREGLSERELVERIIKGLKTELYFDTLHPETVENNYQLMQERLDRNFIREHIPQIDENIYEQGLPVAEAVSAAKVKQYFDWIHPDYDTLTGEEKAKADADLAFIREHIEDFDSEYIEYTDHRGLLRREKLSGRAATLKIINGLKEEMGFTPPDIEQATRGTTMQGFKDGTAHIRDLAKDEQELQKPDKSPEH